MQQRKFIRVIKWSTLLYKTSPKSTSVSEGEYNTLHFYSVLLQRALLHKLSLSLSLSLYIYIYTHTHTHTCSRVQKFRAWAFSIWRGFCMSDRKTFGPYYVYTYIRTRARTHIHTHTHTHTHIYSLSLSLSILEPFFMTIAHYYC